MEKEEAIIIAKAACRGYPHMAPQNVKPVVEFTDKEAIVTWPIVLKEGERGGDYYSRIIIDISTKKVVRGLVSP